MPLRSGCRNVYHLFVASVARRDELLLFLNDHDIGCGIHYPIPIPLLKAYSDNDYSESDFPVTTQAAKEIISLPLFPEMTQLQVSYVIV